MPAFYDATCTKCKRRFGWSGELKNKPPCPKCGHHDKITQADLEDEAYMEEFLQELIKKKKNAKQSDAK